MGRKLSKKKLPDDLFDKILNALKEPEETETEGVKGIPNLIQQGNYHKVVDIMIKIIEDPDPYSINDKITVTEYAKQIAQQDSDIIRRLLPYLYVIYNKNEAPDPVLIMNAASILTLSRPVLYEELNTLKQKIIKISNEISKTYKTNNVPLGDVATRMGLSLVVVLLLVEEMLLNKEINGQYDSVGDILSLETEEVTCYNCGATISKDCLKCPSCQIEFPKCVICRLIIRTVPASCPKCGNSAHRAHFLEWIRMSMDKKKGKGTCPICQNYLTPDDLK